MCGRFVVDMSEATVAEVFEIAAGPESLDVRRSWNVAPGTDQLVVGTDGDGVRRAGRYTWGFVPTWARDVASARKPINARSETVADKPMFRTAFRTGRCLVPATGFYEWDSVSGSKQPWLYTVDDGAPFAFAGLLSRRRLADGEILRTFCLLTTDANALAARVHDRMPAILDPAAWPDWLGGETVDPRTLRSALTPFPAERMTAWPVSRRVNRPVENDPTLLEPVDLG